MLIILDVLPQAGTTKKLKVAGTAHGYLPSHRNTEKERDVTIKFTPLNNVYIKLHEKLCCLF